MTTSTQNIGTKRSLFTPFLGRRMLVYAIIGLVFAGYFVFGAGEGDPAWGRYWQIRPLLLTPLLCAMVGLCYDVTEPLRKLKGWRGKVLLVLSLLGLVIGLWMSLILGLKGTMWD